MMITAQVIHCPFYFNRNISDFSRWLADNQQSLNEYWNQLLTVDTEPVEEDAYFLFTRIQHEREQDRMKELREAYMDRTEYTGRMGA